MDVERLMAVEPQSGENVYIDDNDWCCGSVIKIINDNAKHSTKTNHSRSDFYDWERIEIVQDYSHWFARPVKPGPSKFSYDGGTVDEATVHLLSTPRVDLDIYDP